MPASPSTRARRPPGLDDPVLQLDKVQVAAAIGARSGQGTSISVVARKASYPQAPTTALDVSRLRQNQQGVSKPARSIKSSRNQLWPAIFQLPMFCVSCRGEGPQTSNEFCLRSIAFIPACSPRFLVVIGRWQSGEFVCAEYRQRTVERPQCRASRVVRAAMRWLATTTVVRWSGLGLAQPPRARIRKVGSLGPAVPPTCRRQRGWCGR